MRVTHAGERVSKTGFSAIRSAAPVVIYILSYSIFFFFYLLSQFGRLCSLVQHINASLYMYISLYIYTWESICFKSYTTILSSILFPFYIFLSRKLQNVYIFEFIFSWFNPTIKTFGQSCVGYLIIYVYIVG